MTLLALSFAGLTHDSRWLELGTRDLASVMAEPEGEPTDLVSLEVRVVYWHLREIWGWGVSWGVGLSLGQHPGRTWCLWRWGMGGEASDS